MLLSNRRQVVSSDFKMWLERSLDPTWNLTGCEVAVAAVQLVKITAVGYVTPPDSTPPLTAEVAMATRMCTWLFPSS